MSSLLFNRALFTLSIIVLSVGTATALKEDHVAETCSEYELTFGCGEGRAIVIREAWLHDAFYRVPTYKCQIPEYYVQFKKASVLQHINKKCSLQRNCLFRVFEDIPGAADDETTWKGSVVRVVYECVKDADFISTCGETVEAQKGWIHSIGYPKYYLGPGACTFTIVADKGQRVVLRILDLSLRGIIRPAETECKDYLTVNEGSKVLQSVCGELYMPIVLQSESHVLNLTLHSSDDVYPKRGFIIKFNGCETPEIPQDGYLAHRNASYAEFWCCVRHVFPDTMARVRRLTCRYQMNWDMEVPDCVDLDDLLAAGNITEAQYLTYNGSNSIFFLQKEVVYDILIPGFIMGILVLGNVGILVLIIFWRKGLEDAEKEEELESIKANAEPTDVKDTKPSDV